MLKLYIILFAKNALFLDNAMLYSEHRCITRITVTLCSIVSTAALLVSREASAFHRSSYRPLLSSLQVPLKSVVSC